MKLIAFLKRIQISRVIAIFLFLIWCIVWTNFFYKNLVPKTDTTTVSRENKHRVIGRQDPFIFEVNGGNIAPDKDSVAQLKSKIANALIELGNANSFPFVAKWLLKFDISFALEKVSVKDSNINVAPEVLCNNVLSPNSIIFSQKGIYLQDILPETETSFSKILNSCAINLTSRDGTSLPDEYVAIESYGLTIKSTPYNYILLLIIVILGSFALLSALKEGIKFFKKGFGYFS